MTTLIGPKWTHKQNKHIFTALFGGSREGGGSQRCKEAAEPDHPGGGRGRVNPPPCGLVWGFVGLEGLLLGECIYTPRGQRPRRINLPYEHTMRNLPCHKHTATPTTVVEHCLCYLCNSPLNFLCELISLRDSRRGSSGPRYSCRSLRMLSN